MLSTEEKRNRLEELLVRVRRNRAFLLQPYSAADDEVEVRPNLPMPMEPKPVRRISNLPSASSSAPVTPVEPEPVSHDSWATEPEPVATVSLKAEPVIKVEPEPVAVVLPVPKPGPEPEPVAPYPMPRPISSIADETPRIFEANVQASSPIAAVHGRAEREWTLSAVLKRAWRLGQSDTDNK
jgi:hypothetical protein